MIKTHVVEFYIIFITYTMEFCTPSVLNELVQRINGLNGV